jgi:hypothetical protein
MIIFVALAQWLYVKNISQKSIFFEFKSDAQPTGLQ